MGTGKLLVIWGSAGHASVVSEIVGLAGEFEIAGFIDDVDPTPRDVSGRRVLGGREQLPGLMASGAASVIVGVGDSEARMSLAAIAKEHGFSLARAVHPHAIVSPRASIGAGSVLAAGSVVNPHARIGENCIVNTGATIDHHCDLKEGVHVAPGAHLGGYVTVGRGTLIGIGAIVKDHVAIGASTTVGAGACVVGDLPGEVVAVGVPARVVRESVG